MTDAGDAVDGDTFGIEGTSLSIGITPAESGKVKLTAKHAGETVESGTYSRQAVFTEPGERGKFLSSVEASLEDRPDVDASSARTKLKEWLAEFGDLGKEERREYTLSDEMTEILAGTHYPTEVYRGEPTTWSVTLTFQGETRELEFTTSEMLNDSGGALEEKIANHFLEFLDVGSDDWQEIRDDWVENKKVVDTGDETTADVVANRVLEYIAERAVPVADRDKLANDPKAVWFDESNAAAYGDADPDAPIAWVQDAHIMNELERTGKKMEYKGQLLKTLISRGDLYGKSARRRWGDGQRGRFYPFKPEALGLDADDVGGDEPAHSEVDA